MLFRSQPEMSAFDVTKQAIAALHLYDVIIMNLANCDMVGHTGDFDAAVRAVEAVDSCVGSVVDAVLALNGCAIVTADHGNAEKMREDDGSPFTAHTTGSVPVILCGADAGIRDGALCDVAPTMLELLDMDIPSEMTGKSLLIHL